MLNHKNQAKKTEDNHATPVTCTVGTCTYHGTGNCCHATNIKVGTEYAVDKAETFCATFENKGAH